MVATGPPLFDNGPSTGSTFCRSLAPQLPLPMVKARTEHWSVMVTVRGPQVPGEGLPFQANADTCTWVVTLSEATGTVPVSAADFTAIDDQNNVYKPAFVPGRPKPAATVKPGQKVSFELRAVEATGEGLMRWAPDGHTIVAKWDFVVEND